MGWGDGGGHGLTSSGGTYHPLSTSTTGVVDDLSSYMTTPDASAAIAGAMLRRRELTPGTPYSADSFPASSAGSDRRGGGGGYCVVDFRAAASEVAEAVDGAGVGVLSSSSSSSSSSASEGREGSVQASVHSSSLSFAAPSSPSQSIEQADAFSPPSRVAGNSVGIVSRGVPISSQDTPLLSPRHEYIPARVQLPLLMCTTPSPPPSSQGGSGKQPNPQPSQLAEALPLFPSAASPPPPRLPLAPLSPAVLQPRQLQLQQQLQGPPQHGLPLQELGQGSVSGGPCGEGCSPTPAPVTASVSLYAGEEDSSGGDRDDGVICSNEYGAAWEVGPPPIFSNVGEIDMSSALSFLPTANSSVSTTSLVAGNMWSFAEAEERGPGVASSVSAVSGGIADPTAVTTSTTAMAQTVVVGDTGVPAVSRGFADRLARLPHSHKLRAAAASASAAAANSVLTFT